MRQTPTVPALRPALAALLVGLTSFCPAAEGTIVTVTGEVTVPASAINPVGVHGWGSQGPINYFAGNLLLDAGFEPQEVRAVRRVVSVGEQDGRRFIRIDEGGTSNYLQWASGAFSGTSFRAYRLEGTDGSLKGTAATAARPLGAFTIPAAESPGLPQGGWLAPMPDDYAAYRKLDGAAKDRLEEQCLVYYDGPEALRVDDVVMFARRETQLPATIYHPRKAAEARIARFWQFPGATATQVAHSGAIPAGMDAGDSHLRLVASGEATALHIGFRGPDKMSFYGQLEPGVRYAFSAWMRRPEGSGAVRLTFATASEGGKPPQAGSYFGTPLGGEVTPDGTWRRHSVEFTAPERPTGKTAMHGAAIVFSGGTLELDDVRLQPVYEAGDAERPFVINRTMMAALLASQPAGRKGTLRTWAAMNENTMLDNLAWQAGDRSYPSLPKCLTIAEATGRSADDRMVPWVNVQLSHSEAELHGMIEFLAAPWDPASDTAASKPYAARRAAQRGHGRPWTADFREIVLELGNESWHNRGAGYIGIGRYNAVHSFGHDYGLFARYLITAIRASPHWAAAGGRIRIAINGNYTAGIGPDGKVEGYGPQATSACGLHDYETHANYVGPKWELGEAASDTIADDAYRSYLLSGIEGRERLADYRTALEANNRALGTTVRIAGYEGGPSGFMTDNSDPDHPSEQIGRSRASAVAVADIFASSWEAGWVWQTSLNFGQGIKWSQFSPLSDGFRPDPGWLAMSLLNRTMGEGDVLRVAVAGAPEVVLQKPDQVKQRGKNPPKRIPGERLVHPQVGAYARRDGDRLTTLLVNRSFDQACTVALVLPATPTTLTLHTLSGGPKDTNRGAARVAIVSRPITPADAGAIVLEPANLFLVEARLPR